MKRMRWLYLALALVLLGAVSLAPASTAEAKQPTDFTATIRFKQVRVVNQQQGESDRHRTVEEEFVGKVTRSTWPEMLGARVKIHNFTNYEMVPGARPDTFHINGTVHSTIEIIKRGGTLTIKANGKIEGTIPSGAHIHMNFNSIAGTGSFADAHARGKLDGRFTWLTTPPSGIAHLTGQYQ